MEDWKENPQNYLTDEDGNFILKKDGTPRKKTGRPKGSKGRGYNYHSETKAKIKARRAIRTKEKKTEQLKQRLNAKRDSLNASKETLKKLEKETTNKVVTEDILDKVPKALKNIKIPAETFLIERSPFSPSLGRGVFCFILGLPNLL